MGDFSGEFFLNLVILKCSQAKTTIFSIFEITFELGCLIFRFETSVRFGFRCLLVNLERAWFKAFLICLIYFLHYLNVDEVEVVHLFFN